MGRYALHVGLIDDELHDYELYEYAAQAIQRAQPLGVLHNVHCDGDSFIQWGEPIDPTNFRDYAHGVINYWADDPLEAWRIGLLIYTELLRAGTNHEMPVVALEATCTELNQTPFAVTSADVYSAQVLSTGKCIGDW